MFPDKLLYFRHDAFYAYDHVTAGAWAACAELEYSLSVSNGKQFNLSSCVVFRGIEYLFANDTRSGIIDREEKLPAFVRIFLLLAMYSIQTKIETKKFALM